MYMEKNNRRNICKNWRLLKNIVTGRWASNEIVTGLCPYWS
jgi:hypothetical protein